LIWKPKRRGRRHANFLSTSSGRRPRPPPSELGVFPHTHLVLHCRALRCRLRAPQAVRAPRRFPDLVTAPPVSVLLLALSLPNCIAPRHFLGNAALSFRSMVEIRTSCGRSYGRRAFSVRAALAIRRSPACRAPISWFLGFPFPVCRQVLLLINSEVVMVRILLLY
jgi:hypothetical protein